MISNYIILSGANSRRRRWWRKYREEYECWQYLIAGSTAEMLNQPKGKEKRPSSLLIIPDRILPQTKLHVLATQCNAYKKNKNNLFSCIRCNIPLSCWGLYSCVQPTKRKIIIGDWKLEQASSFVKILNKSAVIVSYQGQICDDKDDDENVENTKAHNT